MGAKAPTFFRGAPEFRFSVILTRRALFSSWPHAKTRVLSEGSAPFPEPNPREPSVRDAAALRLEIKWNFYGKSTPFPSSENTDSLKARSPESTQISRVSHPVRVPSEKAKEPTNGRANGPDPPFHPSPLVPPPATPRRRFRFLGRTTCPAIRPLACLPIVARASGGGEIEFLPSDKRIAGELIRRNCLFRQKAWH